MKTRYGIDLKRTTVLTIACLVLLAAFLALPFYGKAEENTKLYQKITIEETETLLNKLGLFYNQKTSAAGRTFFAFQIGGYKVGLALYNCTKDDKKACTELQMKSYFSTKKEPKDKLLPKVNEWNQRTRQPKSYLDKEGDLFAETILNIRGGVTKETIENFIKDYPLLLNSFVKWFSNN